MVTVREMVKSFQRESLSDRLFRRVTKTATCWLWTGYRDRLGYGRIGRGRRSEGADFTHRVAYELLVGAIPSGMHLDHLCRVPNCLNPEHLEPVTPKENLMRGVGLAPKHAAQTHCKNGHPFLGENLIVGTDRKGRAFRDCRVCKQQRWKSWWEKKRGAA